MGANRRRVGSGCAETGCDAGRAGARGRGIIAAACLVAGIWSWIGAVAGAAPGPLPGETGRSEAARGAPTRGSSPRRPAARVDRSKTILPSDDWTFRPTVVIRRGTSQGSGTIIASVDGEALVLTAAHVVRESGPISVELHRYNLGLERTSAPPGAWPRSVAADVAALDPAADLAVLRIEGLPALPYVARLAPARREPAVDSIVTSIGIDLGRHLSCWSTRLVEALWFELNDNREERLFLITDRAPEHGRSGGGLFLPDGELVGVCIGHAELFRGGRQGVFASRESIRQLLVEHDLIPVIARSERQRSRLGFRPARRPVESRRDSPFESSSTVTPTGAVGAGR